MRAVRLVVMAMIAATLTCEVVLRLAYSDVLFRWEYPLVYQPDEALGYTYIPGATSRMHRPGIDRQVTINAAGFLGREFPKLKDPDCFRIGVIDSSNGTGIWASDGESYPQILEDLLNSGDHRVQVLNFSVDGRYRDVQQVTIGLQRAIEYQPDIVIVRHANIPFLEAAGFREVYRGYVIGYSRDYSDARKQAMAQIDYIESHRFLRTLYEVSYIVRAIARLTYQRTTLSQARYVRAFVEHHWDTGSTVSPWSLRRSMARLRQLHDALAQRGGRLILFDDNSNELLASQSVEWGLTFAGVTLPSRADAHNEHDGHWNQRGHQEVARQLQQIVTIEIDRVLANRQAVAP